MNLLIILVGIGLTFLVIKLMKIKGKSSILLFVLYIVYWIAPLVTRDYTGLMQIHMDINNAILLFIPLTVYGLIGIFWRPLSDIITLKMGSRKKVIYISLALQLALVVPMFIYPCFATNIVQSVGAGVGASCIGLFNLMFNEHESKRRIAFSVAILVVPPLISQFFASAFICIVVSIVYSTHTAGEYLNIVKYLWLVAIIMIVAGFIIAIFIKEKKETLYHEGGVRLLVNSKKDWGAFIIICVISVLMSFMKWLSSSGISSIQITYVANKTGVDTRAFEGYASLISSVGQLVGVVSSSLWLILDNKTKHKRVYLLLFASVIGIIYFVLNSIYVTIPMYIFSSLLNGASYGIYTNILLGIVLGKMFSLKRRLVTPVGVYNTMLAIGIFCGIFVGCIFKQGIFDQMHGFSTYSFKDFKNANMSVNILGGLAVTLSFGLFMLMKLVNSHNRKKKVKIKKEFGVTTGTEM